MRQIIFSLFLLLNASFFAFAQQSSKSLSGEVIYKNGDPVISAFVYIEQGSKHAYTDEKGQFTITDLKSKAYEVIVQPFGKSEIRLKTDLTDASDFLKIQLDENESFELDNVINTIFCLKKLKIKKLKILKQIIKILFF